MKAYANRTIEQNPVAISLAGPIALGSLDRSTLPDAIPSCFYDNNRDEICVESLINDAATFRSDEFRPQLKRERHEIREEGETFLRSFQLQFST